MKYLTINNIEKLQDMVSKQRYRDSMGAIVDSVEDTFEVIYVSERGDSITPIYVIRLEGKNTRTAMWFWVYREIKDGTVRVQKEYDFINTQGIRTTETVIVRCTISCFQQPDVLLEILNSAIWRPL
jgi:hypothetical protein